MNNAIHNRQPSPRPGGKPKPKALQKGVTLFELLLVLFVAAFIAVAVATIYNRVNTTYKENVLFNDIQQLAANIRAIYGSSPDYSGLDEDVVTNGGIAPDSMVSSTGRRITPFHTSSDTWLVTGDTSTGEEFSIQISNLPTAVCTGIASKGLGVANSVTVGSVTSSNIADLASACSATGSNAVTLTYN